MPSALRHPPMSVRSLLGVDDDDAPAQSVGSFKRTDAPTPYVIATLVAWVRLQPHPRGRVSLEDGVVRYTPPTGRPVLAVLTAHPDDTHAQTADAVDEQLAAGVSVVWVIDGRRRTATLYQANDEPVLANRTQAMPDHPALPGFTPAVAELFE